MEHTVKLYRYEQTDKRLIPFFAYGLQAGFPSPGADYMELAIDLNDTLIKNPSSTFIGRIRGKSMQEIGIFDNSLAIIDKSLKVQHNNLVVAFVDGGFTLKQIKIEKKKIVLMPFNADYQPIIIDEANEGIIWGRVTYIINQAL